MSDLTAIDVLIDPDEATMDRARAVNARMLKSLPQGWALDDTHKPHITTLQRYVRTTDLDQVYDAVENTVAETDMASLAYQVVKIAHADWGFPGYGPAGLLVQVSPEVLEFQSKLLAAVSRYTESGGTAAAFVADPGETISPTIVKWVEAYVPDQIGERKYLPHLTVGAAKFEDLKVIEAEPFEPSNVHAAGVAVYHLGNNGTARKLLKGWPITSSVIAGRRARRQSLAQSSGGRVGDPS
jgi:hypothetical protein